MTQHEPDLCKCGHDTIDETPDGPACQCQCEDCTERRVHVLKYWNLRKLEKRLEAAGISADDLSVLLWLKREKEFVDWIHAEARKAIEYELQGMRITLRKKK